MTTTAKIVNLLEGRLIPVEINMEGAMPPGYEEKLQDAYRCRMCRRAHLILQGLPPSDRESILSFLENEEAVREAKTVLEDIGHDERAVAKMNEMARSLIDEKNSIINQAHSHLLEENELMGVFVGGETEALTPISRD
jgi:hypothetical protein